MAVELADGLGVGIVVRGVGYSAVEQNVVGGDQPALPQQWQRALVVVNVVAFIGVDEDEIETAGVTLVDQSVQRIERRSQPQLDSILHAGVAPGSPGDPRVFFADIADDESSARAKPERNPGGAVAHEDADFESFASAGYPRQQVQELALLGRHLPRSARVVFGRFAQPPQRLRFAQSDIAHISQHGIVERGLGAGHWSILPRVDSGDFAPR